MAENKYESLKLRIIDDAPELRPEHETHLSKHPAESVSIFTSSSADCWAWGYIVYWANGHSSHRLPSFCIGVFRTERDAILYGIGFMLSYAEYFKPETVENIKAAERRYTSTSLPLFDEP